MVLFDERVLALLAGSQPAYLVDIRDLAKGMVNARIEQLVRPEVTERTLHSTLGLALQLHRLGI